jgi:hypothetical protein
MWKNTAEQDGRKTTIWRMRIAFWIPKAINTHAEYLILLALPLQQWLHERAPVVRCAYTASLVKNMSVIEGDENNCF